jgi:hypothetical protein
MPANLFAAMRPMGVCAGANHAGEFIRRYAPLCLGHASNEKTLTHGCG